jgi:hypothetical protein
MVVFVFAKISHDFGGRPLPSPVSTKPSPSPEAKHFYSLTELQSLLSDPYRLEGPHLLSSYMVIRSE